MKLTTMRGKVLDLTQVYAQNETAIAVGNANMNARGDIVGPGGKIVKRKEQVAQDYHKNNPNAVKRTSIKEVQPDVFLTPQEIMAELNNQAPQAETPPAKGRKIVDKP